MTVSASSLPSVYIRTLRDELASSHVHPDEPLGRFGSGQLPGEGSPDVRGCSCFAHRSWTRRWTGAVLYSKMYAIASAACSRLSTVKVAIASSSLRACTRSGARTSSSGTPEATAAPASAAVFHCRYFSPK
jgi:hypothetical protein